jgi:hypothetical protein
MEGTDDRNWMGWEEGHDWPVSEYFGPGSSYTYDDPLHLCEAGWVFIEASEEFNDYFFELLFNCDITSGALQALSRHPAFSPTHRMQLAGKVQDADWVGELIASTSTTVFPTTIFSSVHAVLGSQRSQWRC